MIVTGGGSGIGAAIVSAFMRQKANVGFIDIADLRHRKTLVASFGDAASAEAADRIHYVHTPTFAISPRCGLPLADIVPSAFGDAAHPGQ